MTFIIFNIQSHFISNDNRSISLIVEKCEYGKNVDLKHKELFENYLKREGELISQYDCINFKNKNISFFHRPNDNSNFENYIRLITRDSEIYSDILEYGRNGDLSEWLREHDKETLADQINGIDNSTSDNEYIKKISLIILDMIPALRKTNFRECFEQKVELAQTQQNELMLLFSLIPIKDINEDYEIKAVCGLMTKTITFNPSKFDIGVETKKTILYENISAKCLDSIVVYIDGEKIYEDSLKNYYFHSKYEILRKKVYIGSLSEIYLKELIIHYFKATSIYEPTLKSGSFT